MDKYDLEEGREIHLKFDEQGLLPCVTQDVQSKEVLMVAYMNQEAFDKTVETGEAHYWSRSRQELWHKGVTSGAVQIVQELRVDCDQDCIVMLVSVKDGAELDTCHTGRKTCFYRRAKDGALDLID